MSFDLILGLVIGCCIGAAFPLVIKGWIKKVKNKAKQVTNDLR